mmetsp:Transcript_21302/g.66778  ORF Transcript_21302/g.66778 Transcript_21302/m.66778 type:complete len:379 (-) Transcript_21302:310-1446(-)
MESVKVVLLGDGGVGKSCLLIKLTTGGYPHDYVPTTHETQTVNEMVDGQPVSINYWDTAGQADYDNLRPLVYQQTNAFVVCAALNDVGSRDNVLSRWLPEIRRHSQPEVPIILAGTKCDLLAEHQDTVLDASAHLLHVARSIGAAGYFECSALENWCLDDLFGFAASAGLWHRRAVLKGAFARKRKPWWRRPLSNGAAARTNRSLLRLLSTPSKKKTSLVFKTNAGRGRGFAARAAVKCGICLGVCARSESRLFGCCGRRYCTPCIGRYVSGLVDAGRARVPCPTASCGRLLPSEDVRSLAGANRAQHFAKNLAKNHDARLEAIRRDPALAPEFEGTKVCPSCSVVVYRAGGCSHMTCSECGFDFQWHGAESVFADNE